uniref:No apical meristem-associated C-terminal domain-containing protein n=1 Tax=Brassica oleracea var. oleracea TaxID=109376 RepID=A0A0D3DBE2_BRAOL
MLREDPMFKGDGVAHAKRFSNPCGVEYTSLESDNLNLDSPTQASPRLSSSSLNLNDESENISGSPSSRPLGVKKSKMKRKIVDQTNSVINTLERGNNQFREQLKKSSEQRQQHLVLQRQNYALEEMKEENKILFCDLNSIEYPNVCEHFQAEKARILQKRSHQQQNQQIPPLSTSFGQYFDNLCGSGSNLPEY